VEHETDVAWKARWQAASNKSCDREFECAEIKPWGRPIVASISAAGHRGGLFRTRALVALFRNPSKLPNVRKAFLGTGMLDSELTPEAKTRNSEVHDHAYKITGLPGRRGRFIDGLTMGDANFPCGLGTTTGLIHSFMETVVKKDCFVPLCTALFLCASSAPSSAQTGTAETTSSTTPVPADYIPPHRFNTIAEMVPQLHSVVVGNVDFERFVFDDCWGPRTVLRVSKVESIVGVSPASSIELYVFGGPLPDGSFVEVSELPRFVSGDRYVLFLRNTDWRYSPVMGQHAYRITSVLGREILLDSDGHAVIRVGESGVEVGGQAFTEPVGQRLTGMASRTMPVPGLDRPRDAGCIVYASDCPPESADVRRQSSLLAAGGRMEPPKVVPEVSPQAVAGALTQTEFANGLLHMVQASGAKVGGRFLEHPRVGCWRTTPAVHVEKTHENTLPR
jgi:hypothetical protein